MSDHELLRGSFLDFEVNESRTEAKVLLRDRSTLRFCHRPGERWAKAETESQVSDDATVAAQVLGTIAMFRLNARHLEIDFRDGSRWELPLR
ncbi:MAG TPA: hypothetical protein VKI17_01870 [Gemmataceae bacterium]|nr:hypothetical protein [Gemmataceae bacterium]